MKRILRNIDNEQREYENDKDFIKIVQNIWSENEEDDFQINKPESVLECEKYIIDYCPNLILNSK